MIRSIFVIAAALTLSGCAYQSVNNNDIQTAIKVCGSLDNVVEVSALFQGSERVVCSDRKKHWLP